MRERPINLRAWEVRAWLDGRLSQIRRPVKPQPNRYRLDVRERAEMVCPLGAPGDVLWGREAWQAIHIGIDPETGYGDSLDYAPAIPDGPGYWTAAYETDGLFAAMRDDRGFPWRPSTHMPRWASRIRWRIKSVRVERVQDMINADATACGVHSDPGDGPLGTPRHLYSVLWERHYGTDTWDANTWDANPWVWVLEIEGA